MITQLPIDLISDILARLPAKTLIRLKIVCKSLYILISDADFANHHLERSISTNSNLHYVVTTPRMYLQEYAHLPKPHKQSCPVLHSADFDSLDNPRELSHPFKECKTGVWVLGSCRGLLLLRAGYGHLLYNPTTQTYNVLPFLSVYEPARSYGHHDYGFGYVSVAKDYKCVRIMQCYFKEVDDLLCEVMVYSMKMNCWKRAPDVPCYFRPCGWSVGALLHESFHWVGTNRDNEYELIVAFSLRDETFNCLPLPNFRFEQYDAMYMGTLDDCLCLLVNNYRLCTVWVMKEYGVVGSWTMMYSVEKAQCYNLERPISYSVDKKRLLVRKALCMLTYIDLETMESTDVMFTGWERGLDAHVYIENLLMLDYNEFVINVGTKNDQQGKTKKKRRRRRRNKRTSQGENAVERT
ncbi:hypothetical protein RND81_03G185400 [Saponaria officinalis]|uniref:F-box domain-containing protein n=1 Tax=Saponaria officinalis TaxID=3572 RepID=A0AAW1M9I2_SAPOF